MNIESSDAVSLKAALWNCDNFRIRTCYSMKPTFFSAIFYFSFNLFLKFMCLLWGRKVHKQGRGTERGRERIPSRLQAVSTKPDEGGQTHELWDDDLSQNPEWGAQPTEPPRCPSLPYFKFVLYSVSAQEGTWYYPSLYHTKLSPIIKYFAIL